MRVDRKQAFLQNELPALGPRLAPLRAQSLPSSDLPAVAVEDSRWRGAKGLPSATCPPEEEGKGDSPWAERSA